MNVFERRMVCVLGEYGGIGYPVPGHLWQRDMNWGYGKVVKLDEQKFAAVNRSVIGAL